MTAAIFGLLGVVVGGFISGGFAVWRDRQTKKDDLRVAKRLCNQELHLCWLVFRYLAAASTRDDREAIFERATLYGHLTTAHWDEHRAVLARELRVEQWLHVVNAYDSVNAVLSVRGAQDGDVPLHLIEGAIEEREFPKAVLAVATGPRDEKFEALMEKAAEATDPGPP